MDTYSIIDTFSCAVLYTKNLGFEEHESIAYSITEELINDLEYVNTLRVATMNDITQYNNSEPELGPRNMHHFLIKQAKLEGFIVFRWEDQYKDGLESLIDLKKRGYLKYKETIVEGIEKAPETFLKLFSGENLGKLLIKVN